MPKALKSATLRNIYTDDKNRIEIIRYFKEFKQYEENCEFIGCTHIKEENCGIKKAVENGEIDKARYERFCKIYQELKEKEERKW